MGLVSVNGCMGQLVTSLVTVLVTQLVTYIIDHFGRRNGALVLVRCCLRCSGLRCL